MLFGDAGGGCRAALAVAVLALACAFLAPGVARAAEYRVDSAGDEVEASLGNEVCETAAGKCTLRAAIEEANASVGEGDQIRFEEAPFDGSSGGTIQLGSSLPTISDRLQIYGECGPFGGPVQPCVGVNGPGPGAAALVVENTEEIEIDGLAITGAKTGIEVKGTPETKLFYDWFGVRLDRSAGGNGTGVYLGPGSNRTKVGNGGFVNTFANNAAAGLDVFGANRTRVWGNYFGVAPDGVTPAANGEDIEVTSDALGAEAFGTAIGAELGPAELATPVCDGTCNVIAGAGSSGIDLEGESGEGEAPAASTTILGNYIGLGADGGSAVPNLGDGIHVGSASRTIVGGPRSGEANLFAGGASAVRAGPGAANLSVRGNGVGVDAFDLDSAAPGAGVLVNTEGLLGALEEAQIVGNELRMQGGTAIEVRGLGGWITGNAISGAAIGIAVNGPNEQHGNLIEANLVEGSAVNAVLLENERNEVFGNAVLGSGGAGIRIHSLELPFGVSGNQIGGEAAAEENEISGAGGPAIEIADAEKSENEIARNRGSGNAGLFIDLVSLDPATEPKGPNGGLKPAVIQSLTTTRISGLAEPDAVIRLFRKASSSPGEVESFLAEAVADDDGFWELEFAVPLPASTFLAATQTVEGRRTSELAIKSTPEAPKGGGGAGPKPCPNCVPPFVPGPAPNTKLLAKPAKKSQKRTAVFKFRANQGNVTFRCRLDGKSWGKCRSPKKYRHLKPGKHSFRVRAVGATGSVDGSPAKYTFRVLR